MAQSDKQGGLFQRWEPSHVLLLLHGFLLHYANYWCRKCIFTSCVMDFSPHSASDCRWSVMKASPFDSVELTLKDNFCLVQLWYFHSVGHNFYNRNMIAKTIRQIINTACCILMWKRKLLAKLCSQTNNLFVIQLWPSTLWSCAQLTLTFEYTFK